MWKKLSRTKSCYDGMNCGFAEISDREIGIGRPRNFSRRFSASQVPEISVLNFNPVLSFSFQSIQ